MPKTKQLVALGLTGMLLASNTPRAEAQAEALAIPCVASGVCIVVGSVVAGGILYYVIQNKRTESRFKVPTGNGNYENHDYPIVRPGPAPMRTQYNQPGKREVHAAANADGCQRMLERFRRQGRNLKLVEVRRVRNAARDGGVMQYQCIFEGSDSTDGYYNDRRY
jgi:hypothetical protein